MQNIVEESKLQISLKYSMYVFNHEYRLRRISLEDIQGQHLLVFYFSDAKCFRQVCFGTTKPGEEKNGQWRKGDGPSFSSQFTHK